MVFLVFMSSPGVSFEAAGDVSAVIVLMSAVAEVKTVTDVAVVNIVSAVTDSSALETKSRERPSLMSPTCHRLCFMITDIDPILIV